MTKDAAEAGRGAWRAWLGYGIGAALFLGLLAAYIVEPWVDDGTGSIDTSDPVEIAALVEEGLIPPGLPAGSRLRAVWGGQGPVKEVWFHASGGSAEGYEDFQRRLRSFSGGMVGLSRLGPPDFWSNFSEPATMSGVVPKRQIASGPIVLWRVEFDRLLRIRGRLMTTSARNLGLTQ
ncbi:MAG: hypothetical protein AAF565_21210 [Pseudomonadota bacterium]